MATKHRPSMDRHHAAQDLISLKTAAALVDVNAKTVKNWIDAGDLQGFRLNGRLWRVNRKELLALALPFVAGARSDDAACRASSSAWRF